MEVQIDLLLLMPTFWSPSGLRLIRNRSTLQLKHGDIFKICPESPFRPGFIWYQVRSDPVHVPKHTRLVGLHLMSVVSTGIMSSLRYGYIQSGRLRWPRWEIHDTPLSVVHHTSRLCTMCSCYSTFTYPICKRIRAHLGQIGTIICLSQMTMAVFTVYNVKKSKNWLDCVSASLMSLGDLSP